MHCCIFHHLKFPMNGFSVGDVRKGRTSKKRKYAWTFRCLLLLSSANGHLKLYSGGSTWEELHGMWERMARGQDPAVAGGDETGSSREAWSSLLVQFKGRWHALWWGAWRVWGSSNRRMTEPLAAGYFQLRKAACNGSSSKRRLLWEGVTGGLVWSFVLHWACVSPGRTWALWRNLSRLSFQFGLRKVWWSNVLHAAVAHEKTVNKCPLSSKTEPCYLVLAAIHVVLSKDVDSSGSLWSISIWICPENKLQYWVVVVCFIKDSKEGGEDFTVRQTIVFLQKKGNVKLGQRRTCYSYSSFTD